MAESVSDATAISTVTRCHSDRSVARCDGRPVHRHRSGCSTTGNLVGSGGRCGRLADCETDLRTTRCNRPVGHPGGRRQGQGPAGRGGERHRVRRRRARLPDPAAHRRCRDRRLFRGAQPPVHASWWPSRAERGDRGQDQARLRVRLLGVAGARHERWQACGVHRVRRLVRSGRRGHLPGPVLDDVSRGDHVGWWRTGDHRHRRRERLPGHDRAARRRRVPGERKCCSSSAPTTLRVPSTRRPPSRRSANGRSSTASGSSPTRSTSTSPTARTSSPRCRPSCPTWPTSASSSTASPRRMR